MHPYHKGRLLIVNDDAVLRRVLRIRFKNSGYDVITVADGKDALRAIEEDTLDLVVLDVMESGLDNYFVCRELRKESDIPIIILTTLGGIEDRIYGFECGADDYLVKPFSLKELEARISSILRRTKWRIFKYWQTPASLQVGELKLDLNQRKVTFADRPLQLTDREFDILKLLMRNSGVILSRAEILQKICGYLPQSQESLRKIDVYISRIRNYIETNPRQPEYIFTVRGTGYLFRQM